VRKRKSQNLIRSGTVHQMCARIIPKRCKTLRVCVVAMCPLSSSSLSGSVIGTNCSCNINFFGANGSACKPCPADSSSVQGSLHQNSNMRVTTNGHIPLFLVNNMYDIRAPGKKSEL